MLDQFINKINNLEKQSIQIVNRIVLSDSADLNREQLRKGKNADGLPISKQIVRAGATDYSVGYKKQRQRKGLQTSHIDAKFTGKYHRLIKTRKKGVGVFEVESTDPKADEVEKNLGNLEGLNPEALKKLENEIATEIELNILTSLR